MEKFVWFDMDGTLGDFYAVPHWLEYLEHENVFPYTNAAVRVDPVDFSDMVNTLRSYGYKVGIISWLSKDGSDRFNEAVTMAKLFWLAIKFPKVEFDEIHIVEYGTPKHEIGTGYLFDDEKRNRDGWGAGAFDVNNIIADMVSLCVN